jgi:hypothetical protein
LQRIQLRLHEGLSQANYQRHPQGDGDRQPKSILGSDDLSGKASGHGDLEP